jgi:hypothetical protein
MTDTTTTAAAAAPTAAAPVSALNAFFASLKADWEVLEQDVISVIQNIGADVEVAAEDLTYCLSWLGSHIGQVAQTVQAVQSSVTALSAAGVPIPASLASGITQLNDAVAGVNQAVAANASTALTDGYDATKTLQSVAAQVAVIAASVSAVTAPPTATPAATPAA